VVGRKLPARWEHNGFYGVALDINWYDVPEWEKCYGGSSDDLFTSVDTTTDGGYIMTGISWSSDGDLMAGPYGNTNHGDGDVLVVKTDAFGNIQWQKCYGGSSGQEWPYAIKSTKDGGYILAATAMINSGLPTNADGDLLAGPYGNTFHQSYNTYPYWSDFWIVKLDASGNVQWQKCFGGGGGDTPYDIQQTADGGYIAVGYTRSYWEDGDLTFGGVSFHRLGGLGNSNAQDAWVIKIDGSGTLQWQKCFGPSRGLNSVQQTTDGGYIFTGGAGGSGGDFLTNRVENGGGGLWIVKTDGSGNIQWQTSLNGGDGYAARQTSDNGYIALGYAMGNGGIVNGWHAGFSSNSPGSFFNSADIWVVKLNASGVFQWQRCLGGSGYENGTQTHNLKATQDGGCILTGYNEYHSGYYGDGDLWLCYKDNGGVATYTAGNDLWIVKLDALGNISWQKSFGSQGIERYYTAIQQTRDGSYIAGCTTSADDNGKAANGFHGGEYDFWVVKLGKVPQ
jgi:hypothetical protein